MITLLLLSTPLLLQQPGGGQFLSTWEHPLPQNGERVLPISDLDGDGVQDWLHMDRFAEQNAVRQGSVTAISGKSGTEIWTFFGPDAFAYLDLESTGIVDFENDGRMELLLSLPEFNSPDWSGGGVLYVLDSVTGQIIWQQGGQAQQEKFSKNLLVADIDGDGVQELIASSRGTSTVDKVSCFSAAGNLLWQTDLDFKGPTIQAVDLNGNGTPELLLLEPTRMSGGMAGLGRISVLAGGTGLVLWKRWGSYAREKFGEKLILEDLDQDGVLEILSFGPHAMINGLVDVGTVARISPVDGTEIWRLSGESSGDQFGRTAEVADVDGDGVTDLVVGIPTHAQDDGLVQAFDGGTASLIWQSLGTPGAQLGHGQNIWLKDFQNSGFPQVLIEQRVGRAAAATRHFHGWQLFEAASGQMIWETPLDLIAWDELDYQISDLDGDGILEVVMSSPHVRGGGGVGGTDAGLVIVMDGNGQVLWGKRGRSSFHYYGKQVHLGDFNADGDLDLMISAHEGPSGATAASGMVETRDGRTGDLIWRKLGERQNQQLGYYTDIADLNHDGAPEVLCTHATVSGWRGVFQGEFQILDGADGETLLRLEGDRERAFFPKAVVASPDNNADGWDEILLLGNDEIVSISGHGNFQPFLSASQSTISAAAGGTIDLQLAFTPKIAWQEYRVVFSGHGVGLNYQFGLPIPLVIDHWLHLSIAGGLPPTHFHHGEGVLDSNGKGLCQIRFAPGEIPPALIGVKLTFAALTRIPWQDWQYCSVPVSVSIQP